MKNFRYYLLGLLAVVFVIAIAFFARPRNALAIGQPIADSPAVHNMVILGEKTVYLSHLPLFQEAGKSPMPHRYQAILEVNLEKQADDYVQDRLEHPSTTIYTLNPESFVLPDLIASDSPLDSFQAEKIFRGHLERDNSLSILENIGVDVKQIVHFRELNTDSTKPMQLEYLLFGKDSELFLAHLITAPPDFDQLLSVEVNDRDFSNEELAEGIEIRFPETKNSAADRLKAGQQIAGVAIAQSSDRQLLQINVKKELYFEEGELKIPPMFETTEEEERGNFP